MGDCLKALLVGSSFSAAPIFFALKNYGLHVTVCGSIAADPCHQYADASIYIDYSKPDELMRVVKSNQFDFLVPTCNDYSYMSCAIVAEHYGFHGFDQTPVTNLLHVKSHFRQFTEKHLLPAPRFSKYQEGQPLEDWQWRFPLLVKPVDSFSGRGMTKVMHNSALPSAVRDAIQMSRSREVVLEEFIDGCLHSHSAFLEKQEVVCDCFVDEFCTVYPYQVNCSNHPSVLPDTIRSAVRGAVNQLARTLALNDGLLHTQFIVKENEFWIIECMRRCPGDLYGVLVERSIGVNYTDLFVRPFLKMKLPHESCGITPRYYGRHTISVNRSLVNFSFSHNIPANMVEIVSLKGSGEKLGAAPFDKLAILFAEYENREIMLAVTPRLADFVRIREHGNGGG